MSVTSVTAAGNANATALPLTNILAPKNGYAYIYVSNRSDQDVFFDNLAIGITAGNIIEENHYYPFGLKIAAISSHKLGDASEGKLSNPYLYNDKEELDENTTLSWYDYGFRNYDPQIGRFPQLDPLTDGYPELTPFQYATNDPITNVDIDGLEGCPSVGGLSGYVGHIASLSIGASVFNGIAALARINAAVSIGMSVLQSVANVVKTSSQQSIVTQQNANNSINSRFTTEGAGSGTNGMAGNGDSGGHSSEPAVDDDEPGDDDRNITIPIFWEEQYFPAIEDIDMEYFESMAPIDQKLVLPGDAFVYLIFHKGASVDNEPNRTKSRNSYDGPPNPNGKIFHGHEVPYASTRESKKGPGIRKLTLKTQNEMHGQALLDFTRRNNLEEGQVFYVPLRRRTVQIPVPIPLLKYERKNIEAPKPSLPPDYILIPIWVPIAEGVEEFWWLILL